MRQYRYTTSKMRQFFPLCLFDSTGEYSTRTYVYLIPTYKLSLIINYRDREGECLLEDNVDSYLKYTLKYQNEKTSPPFPLHPQQPIVVISNVLTFFSQFFQLLRLPVVVLAFPDVPAFGSF
jgi:hypothetical protein